MSELESQILQDPEFTVEQIVGQLSRALRVPEDLMPSLLRLPSTAGGFTNLENSAKGLNAWRGTLSRGILPTEAIGWPGDGVFREALLGALAELDMGKFTRRHPALINVLLKNVMEVLARYEQDRKEVMGPDAEAGENTESGKEQKQEKGKGSREGCGCCLYHCFFRFFVECPIRSCLSALLTASGSASCDRITAGESNYLALVPPARHFTARRSGDQQKDGEQGQQSGDAGSQAGQGKGGGDQAEQQARVPAGGCIPQPPQIPPPACVSAAVTFIAPYICKTATCFIPQVNDSEFDMESQSQEQKEQERKAKQKAADAANKARTLTWPPTRSAATPHTLQA